MTAPPPLLDPALSELAPFVDAGVLHAAEVHVAAAVARATGERRAEVLLGVALAARAPLFGHVCVVPAEVAATIVVDDQTVDARAPLAWPDAARWHDALISSPAVREPDAPDGAWTVPLVFDGTRLYLDRYWRFERLVADVLLERAGARGEQRDATAVGRVLDGLFDADDPAAPDLQRAAAALALTRRLAVVAGGPGTGKTRTVARLLAAAYELAAAEGRRLDVALAAPTGKAAARLTEAVREEAAAAGTAPGVRAALSAVEASTLHRLLGGRPGGRFSHGARNPLPHDLVVVDETSMVSLPLMAHLLEAVRPDSSVVLVGDPFQLASVEAGAVLGEIVGTAARGGAPGPLARSVVMLDRVHRFGRGSAIAALADAIRHGDADHAVAILRDPGAPEVDWVDADVAGRVAEVEREVAQRALAAIQLARAGDVAAALELAGELKVLCATHHDRLGVARVTERVEAYAAQALPDAGIGRGWYVGRPVVVSANDYAHRLFNGDVGITVARPGRPAVVFPGPSGLRSFAASQLPAVSTWWATTIHKSQGSEFAKVVVTLPPPPSPVLTRELLYTAVTRAMQHVTLVASDASLRAAVARPVARASGLGARLWPQRTGEP